MSKKRARSPAQTPNPEQGDRLQKVLAAAGVASRRECEQLIVDGRVEVDGQVVVELGTRVDANRSEIRVDGVTLRVSRRLYFALNKPPGVLSTNRDPEGRLRVVDLLPSEERLFTVGRLDRASEGLMLVTNDGDLAFHLTHPRYGVPKTYLVQVVGEVSAETLAQLRKGVYLAEGFARVSSMKIRKRKKTATELEMVLTEGKNREIRRLLARVGHKVVTLRRIAIGPLRLGNMPVGAHRPLTRGEIENLQSAVKTPAAKRTKKRSRPAGRKKATRKKAASADYGAATVLDYDSPKPKVKSKGKSKPSRRKQTKKRSTGGGNRRPGSARSKRKK